MNISCNNKQNNRKIVGMFIISFVSPLYITQVKYRRYHLKNNTQTLKMRDMKKHMFSQFSHILNISHIYNVITFHHFNFISLLVN